MEPEQRTILHLDMDAFFAQVEMNDNPELEGKPVIVGGLGPRGVVSTASYEAREYGVHSAMPMVEARRLCPDAEFLSPRGERYSEIARTVRHILQTYTPDIQPVSLDEAFLDITGTLHKYGSPESLGQQLREDVRNATNLTCSVGIGPNKMIAKLASEQAKPDGLLHVPREKRESFLRPLPIDAIWGVGPRTKERMQEAGYETIGDLQDASLMELEEHFGEWAIVYKKRSRGEDRDPVKTRQQAKSISNETTFSEDIEDPEHLEQVLYRLAARVGRRLREKQLLSRTVKIKVRRGDFTTLTRRRTLPEHTDLTENIWQRARDLFRQQIELDDRGIRLLGVGVANLQEKGVQPDLFEDEEQSRRSDVNQLMDEINEEYGQGTITRGVQLRDSSS